jgi:hypothetical protein
MEYNYVMYITLLSMLVHVTKLSNTRWFNTKICMPIQEVTNVTDTLASSIAL